MSWLEIIGSGAIWIVATFIACMASAVIGNFFGRGKEMAGLIYVIYPPIIILILSAAIGLVLLGRISA
jgi:hypothetical protein